MSKVERKMLAHFIDASFGSGSADWYRLGKDLEEYNVELNPNTETKANILGETSFIHNGYEETAEATPFYADEDDKLAVRLMQICDERSTGALLETKALDVKLWKGDESTGYEAYIQDVMVQPTSYGGDTGGVQIPFTVTYTGNRKKGLYKPKTKEFVEESSIG